MKLGVESAIVDGVLVPVFNAMRPFAHRDPGIVGAALARDGVTVELILGNLAALGATLGQAIDAATRVPAPVARRADLDTLAPGAAADVVVLDDNLEIRRVLVGGAERVAA